MAAIRDYQKDFGPIRSILFPVYKSEIPKLIPLFASFFLIAFIYSLLRPAKLALILSSKGSGAEVVPFLKVYAVLPTALFFVFLISKLSNKYSREKVFYIIISIFLSFFAIFTFILYPNREMLELTTLGDYLQSMLRPGLKGFVDMIRYWPISAFYVISELWATIILTTLFWGFVNQITSVGEAARFYALFSLSANFSGIFAGNLSKYISDYPYIESLSCLGPNPWAQHLSIIMSLIIVAGLITIAIFYKINRQAANYVKREKKKTKKYKLSTLECFSYVLRFRYLSYIAVMVISYSIINNLTEVIWQSKIKEHFAEGDGISKYVAHTTTIIGYISATIDMFFTGNIIRIFGWGIAALMTPIVAIATGMFFYASVLSEQLGYNEMLYAFFNNPSTNLLIMFSTAHVCATRGLKYTLFDASKEIAYIPITTEAQHKGKAAIDGVCSRFGKSGGSIIFQLLFYIFGSLEACIPYVIGIIFLLMFMWISTVTSLNKHIKKTDINKIREKFNS